MNAPANSPRAKFKFVPHLGVGGIQRKPDKQGLALNEAVVYPTPHSGICTKVAIIPHDKVLSGGNDDGGKVLGIVTVLPNDGLMLQLTSLRFKEFQAIRPEFLFQILLNFLPLVGRQLHALSRGVINIENLIDYLNLITGKSHHSLDIVDPLVFRILKDDDIPPLWRLIAEEVDGISVHIGKGNFEAIGKFINQNKVSNHQGGDHGTGWNPKRLKKDRSKGKYQDDDGKNRPHFLDDPILIDRALKLFSVTVRP